MWDESLKPYSRQFLSKHSLAGVYVGPLFGFPPFLITITSRARFRTLIRHNETSLGKPALVGLGISEREHVDWEKLLDCLYRIRAEISAVIGLKVCGLCMKDSVKCESDSSSYHPNKQCDYKDTCYLSSQSHAILGYVLRLSEQPIWVRH